MNKRLKKATNMALAIFLLFTNTFPVFASNNDNLVSKPITLLAEKSNENIDISLFADIPIFFAEVEADNEERKDSISEFVSKWYYEEALELRGNIEMEGLRQLPFLEVTALKDNPIYLSSLKHYEERIENGEDVDYIIFYVPITTSNSMMR